MDTAQPLTGTPPRPTTLPLMETAGSLATKVQTNGVRPAREGIPEIASPAFVGIENAGNVTSNGRPL